MANFVLNKIICTEEILNECFIDYYPIDENKKLEEPYISFNKLLGVKTLNEYAEKYGEYIYYGYGFQYEKNEEGLIEIKFLTKYLYPIYAIIKAVEKFKEKLIWYACEENKIYLSKFFWNEKKVEENTVCIENTEYNEWISINEDYIEEIEYPDDEIWHYDFKNRSDWKIWESSNLIERYINRYPAKEYYNEMHCDTSNKENLVIQNPKQDTNKMYYFLFVKYDDCDGDCKEYNYISNDLTIRVGDRILVDRMGNLAVATVENAGLYNECNAPYPVDMTKSIIKKVNDDFELDDFDFYDEKNNYDQEFENEDTLTINIEDTYFRFGVSNYVQEKNNDDNWTKIKLIIKNRYFNYYKNSELMTSAELERLLSMLERLLEGKINKKEEIEFYEPDLTFKLYPKLNLWKTGKFAYIKKEYEIQDIYMELHIHLQDNDGAYISQEYIITFDREEIEKIKTYIERKIQMNS